MILGGLNTTDPGDIHDTITSLAQHSIRCSVIGLAAEVQVCRTLAKATAGTYGVVMHEKHFKELLFKHVPPLPTEKNSKKTRRWVRMGFPQKRVDACPSLCACHTRLSYQGYYCPKCGLKFCELPIECTGCGLTLISSPHLARSYHHLFVVPSFPEITTEPHAVWTDNCFACQISISSYHDIRSGCPRCHQRFCVDCDVYIHNSLHNCPGCASQLRSSSTSAPTSSASSSSTASAFLSSASSSLLSPAL